MKRLTALVLLLLLAGCSSLNLPWLPARTPTPGESQTPAVQTAAPTQTPAAATQQPTPAVLMLRLWLPPEFDPESGSPAGELLRQRLAEFETSRPNIRLDVRLKNLEGAGGMINSLTTTSAAAPLALPDLVLLPRPTLESAILKGLAYPYDDFAGEVPAEWLNYAAELARFQDHLYGIPLAGDVLVLLYQTELIAEPPINWESTLQVQSPLLFPAAQEQALFTLAQYQAAGGEIQDAGGRPLLELEPLTAVLGFYAQAHLGGQMPFWLTQYEDDAQVWQAYLENTSPLAVTWLSNHLKQPMDGVMPAPLPVSGEPFTLASGWLLALTSPDPARQALAVELAAFLVEPDFAAAWSEAAGYLPVQEAAMNGWQNPAMQAFASRMLESAHALPPSDVLNTLGPALQNAAIQVLKEQIDSATAAAQAVDKLSSP